MIDKKKVVVEGCNGEWSQSNYLPVLLKKALIDEIALYLIDIVPELDLKNPHDKTLYNELLRENKIQYINKIQYEQSYKDLNKMDYVFVVTPDRCHSEIACFWLDRIAQNGKIIIEKPLDSSLESANKLRDKILKFDKLKTVFGFDHYIAKVNEFNEKRSAIFDEIGDLRKIEVKLLESSGIKPERAKTLDRGIILDIYCHVLSILNIIIDNNFLASESILSKIEIKRVDIAKYMNSPITEETFAYIHIKIGNIDVHSIIGKNVSNKDCKSVILSGSKTSHKLNLNSNFENNILSNSVIIKNFINDVLNGKQFAEIKGIQQFNESFNILKIIDLINKKRKKSMNDYSENVSIDKIASTCNFDLDNLNI